MVSIVLRCGRLSIENPNAFEGDPDGHPDEDWEGFRGRVAMLVTDENGNEFWSYQIMTFKWRLGDDGYWKLVRWINDPISCEDSNAPTGNCPSWGSIKLGIWST